MGSPGRSVSRTNCRRSPSRNARRTTRSPRSRGTASPASWSSPPDRRRSATPCWTHPSPWRLGCSTTTRTATTRSPAFVDGQPAGNLTRDHILDNITLYWLTGTGASAPRWFWESGRAAARAAGQAPPPVSVPVGYTTFPGELWAAPRSWVEVVYPGLAYFNEVDKGGHFAAWEEPELFSSELRAAFTSLR
jgi:pimeloyl-ACP methyl ester carboxylesterase